MTEHVVYWDYDFPAQIWSLELAHDEDSSKSEPPQEKVNNHSLSMLMLHNTSNEL